MQTDKKLEDGKEKNPKKNGVEVKNEKSQVKQSLHGHK